MKRDGKATDLLVTTWLEKFLNKPDLFLSLPLTNDTKSPRGVNIKPDFVSNEIGITISEARRRRGLILPLINKMVEKGIIIEGASSRENIVRQRILGWYNSLTLQDKKQLPRSVTYKNNISFTSMGGEKRSWATQATQFEWIAKTIDEIHEDLHKVGVIDAEFKTVNERKRPVKDINAAMLAWVSKISVSDDELWSLPISKALTPLGFNITIEHIQKTLGVSYNSAYKVRELAYPLVEKMFDKEILVASDEENSCAGVELRRKLLNWYRCLTIDEKKALPIFGNKVSLKRIPKDKRPINKSDFRYNLVKNAWGFIHQDLEKLGVISLDYQSVADQKFFKTFNHNENHETQKDRFARLAFIPLNSQADLIEPTKNEPFVQVEQIFASRSKSVSSESGKSNYSNACSLFIEFLSEQYGTSPLIIFNVFDEHLLSRYRKYLQQQIITQKISSHHANTILSAVRNALRRLTQVRDLKYSFYDIEGFETGRSTDFKKPFTKNERLQILDAIKIGIKESKAQLKPYQKTGIGQNPLDDKGGRIRGLSNLDNARWLFENSMKCIPVHHNTAKSPEEKAFLQIIEASDKGLSEVYSDWAVTPMIGVDLITPYILRLAQVTGLNVEPLLSLDIDDYVDSHPATSRPCLRYWKERSDGHKEYHLDLFNAQLTWLSSGQARSVKQIFEEVIKLTSSIRQNIDDDRFKNRLFIYQSNSSQKHGVVFPFVGSKLNDAQLLGRTLSFFVEKYGLQNEKGEPLTLTISRFRPTFVSEMLDNGVSLREIQLMLGHSSIQTTIRYLDSLDFNSISRKKLNDKLREIHQSALDEQCKETKEMEKPKNNDEILITFQTPLAECKNIFDPPEFIKNLSSYTPGTPCSQYNKCLSCDNVVITAKNLSEIFAMKRDYTHLIEHTRVMDTPYGHVVRENLELIKGIIDPELSDFSTEELKNGQRLAEYIEDTILVDGVV